MENALSVPVSGFTWTIRFPANSVTYTSPVFGSTPTPWGTARGISTGYSVNAALRGSNTPILLPANSEK